MSKHTGLLIDGKTEKIYKSKDYNFYFNKINGLFLRWGKTKDDDLDYSPIGPEHVDMEISEVCSGVNGIGVCQFCYKSNTPNGVNMSLETFKKVFNNLPKSVCQIAFGIGDLPTHQSGGNPDMWDIFEYTREKGVIPNVTINGEGITDEVADKLSNVCGGIAVSVYDKEKSYNAIKKLTDRGMKNVNIHFMISEETFEKGKKILNDYLIDERLKNLHAIVFLSLKQKGRASKGFTRLSQFQFNELVNIARKNDIPLGFDSCSAVKAMNAFKDSENYQDILNSIEPCESTRFSMYINVEGKYFPCSFVEKELIENGGDWRNGIDLTRDDLDFMKDVWNSKDSKLFREKSIKSVESGNGCLYYEI